MGYENLKEVIKNINISCHDCKWIKFMGEHEDDLCENTSLSGHPVEFAAGDFWCNRFEFAAQPTVPDSKNVNLAKAMKIIK